MKTSKSITTLLELIEPLTLKVVEDDKKRTLKEGLIYTPFAEMCTRMNIQHSAVRVFGKYVKPSAKITDLNCMVSSGQIVIECDVTQDGKTNYIKTEVIYAGGYNIQKLHLRYITKTDLEPLDNKDFLDKAKKAYKGVEKFIIEEKNAKRLALLSEIYKRNTKKLKKTSKEDYIKECLPNTNYFTKLSDMDSETLEFISKNSGTLFLTESSWENYQEHNVWLDYLKPQYERTLIRYSKTVKKFSDLSKKAYDKNSKFYSDNGLKNVTGKTMTQIRKEIKEGLL